MTESKATVGISRTVTNRGPAYVTINIDIDEGPSIRVQCTLADYAKIVTGLMVPDLPATIREAMPS